MIKIIVIIILYSLCLANAEEEIEPKFTNCKNLIKDSEEVLNTLKVYLKEQRDIKNKYTSLDTNSKVHPECNLWQRLKVGPGEVEMYKHLSNFVDKSYDLPKDRCTDIKIDTSNMPKNKMQGDLRWCFAFTATDLLSYNEKAKLSSYDMASQYHLNRADKADLKAKTDITQAAGNPVDALIIVLESKRICSEEQTDLANGDWDLVNKMMKDILSPDFPFSETLCNSDLYKKGALKVFTMEIAGIIEQMSNDKKLGTFFDTVCKDRHQLKNEYETYYSEVDEDTTQADVMKKLDHALNTKQPVAAGYASDMLTHGQNFVGVPDHESTIIGRMFNDETKQCEYLIKNSWGPDCDQAAPTIRCINGDYWVPRTLLQKNIDDVQWITPKTK